MDRLIRLVVASSLLFGLWPGWVNAVESTSASIRMIGPASVVRIGEILTVELQIDSQGRQINASEISLRYPEDRLEVLYVGRENSIFSLWPVLPEWRSIPGLVTMSAGRPGGFYALNASVATVYFRVLQSGPAKLSLEPERTTAYLHDGRGTRLVINPAQLELTFASDLVPGIDLISTTHPVPAYWSHGRLVHVGWVVEPETEYSYRFETEAIALPDDTPKNQLGSIEYSGLSDGIYYFTIKQRARGGPWSGVTQRRFLIDGTPPEPFKLDILPAEALDGKRRLAWSPHDKTSGVVRTYLTVGAFGQGDVMSPLIILSKWGGQRLVVTAVDAAGNETRSILQLSTGGIFTFNWWWLSGLVVAAVGIVFLRRRASR